MMFSELVKETCGKNILPIDDNHSIIQILADGLMGITDKSDYTRYSRGRINELGKSLENEIKAILENNTKIELLPYSQHAGYPDLRLKLSGDTIFVEIKTSGQPENHNSTQRVFYYTNGRKITADGHHLLIQLFLQKEQNNPNSYVFKDWKIKDLYYLNIGLKEEYNASYRDLNNLPELCSS